MGGAILGPGDLKTIDINPSGALKLSYSQNFFFAYLNEGPFLTQSLTHLSTAIKEANEAVTRERASGEGVTRPVGRGGSRGFARTPLLAPKKI